MTRRQENWVLVGGLLSAIIIVVLLFGVFSARVCDSFVLAQGVCV